MRTIQKTVVQGNLFDQPVSLKEYSDYYCLIDKDCFDDFFKEFSEISIDIKKYDVGPFLQIECKTESSYQARKIAEKYFMRSKKILTK